MTESSSPRINTDEGVQPTAKASTATGSTSDSVPGTGPRPSHKPGSEPLVLHLATIDTTVRHLLLPQLLALQEAGYNVAAASNPGPGAVAAQEAGIPFYPVSIDRTLISLNHFRATYAIYRLLRSRKVYLLHVHTPVAATLGRLAAWLARTPVVFYTAHGFYFHENMAPSYRRLLITVERMMGKVTHHLFSQSAEDYQTALDTGIAREEHASVLGNGVDVEGIARVATERRQTVRAELGLQEEIVVAFTGRFVHEKGIAELLEAVARVRRQHSSVRLLIIGGSLPSDRDPAEADLASLVERLHLEDILITTGFSDRVADYLGAADVFVLPSYREGMPRSILEAMAAGLPVVATDIRGSREEVVEEVTGFLVPVRNVEQLADRIALLASDSALRERLGTAGRERARELFDERLVFERLADVYGQHLKPGAD